MKAGHYVPRDPDAFERWLTWADSYADCVDPTVNARPKDPGRIDIDRALVDSLDLTSRTRVVLKSLGIVDSEQLVKLTGDQLKTACEVEVAEVSRQDHEHLGGIGV